MAIKNPDEAIAAAKERRAEARQEKNARDFVDFVLRHTMPERAKAHGIETVHDIIKHHPFAKEHAPKEGT